MLICAWFFALGNIPPTLLPVVPPELYATWYFPVPPTHQIRNRSNLLLPHRDKHPKSLVPLHLTTQFLVSSYSLWLLTSGFIWTHYHYG